MIQVPLSGGYSRERAVRYARMWALSRNPLFGNFDGLGGDCTSFVSQCLYAGCCVMDYTPTFGWFYTSMSSRAPAWTGVKYLNNYLTGSGGYAGRGERPGPYGINAQIGGAMPGDVIQLADFSGNFYHTLIVSEIKNGEILVCSHTYDELDKPLEGYEFASLRVIHILGARGRHSRSCFDRIMSGGR